MTTYYFREGHECTSNSVELTKDPSTATTLVRSNCHRCGGAGGSQAWAHTGWTCYECGGRGHLGKKEVKVYTAEKLAKLNVSLEKRQATKEAKRQSKWLNDIRLTVVSHRAEVRALSNNNRLPEDRRSEFLYSLRQQLRTKTNLSDKQWDSISAAVNRQAEWNAQKQRSAEAEAEAPPVPQTDERLEVEGVILTTCEKYSQFGVQYKMLVAADQGFKLWGTIPRGLDGDLDSLKGRHVTFSARVERSDDDDKFGFFSRPTKARFTTEAAA